MKSILDIQDRLVLSLYDADGELIERVESKNTATDWARAMMASMLTGGMMDSMPTYIALGTGTGTSQPSDQYMVAETFLTRKPYSYRSTFQVYTAQITVNYATTDPNGTFTEGGLWDSPPTTTSLSAAAASGAPTISADASTAPPVYQNMGIYINDSANPEYATIATTTSGTTWTITAPLKYAHASGTSVVAFTGNLWAHTFLPGNGITKSNAQALIAQWQIYHVSQ